MSSKQRTKNRDIQDKEPYLSANTLASAVILGVGAVIIAIGLPIMKHFDNQGMANKRAKQEKTEKDWDKHILKIESDHHISNLELTTTPDKSVLYIGRATYINEVGKRCAAPVVGDSSVDDLIPEPGETFPNVSIAFAKEVCPDN